MVKVYLANSMGFWNVVTLKFILYLNPHIHYNDNKISWAMTMNPLGWWLIARSLTKNNNGFVKIWSLILVEHPTMFVCIKLKKKMGFLKIFPKKKDKVFFGVFILKSHGFRYLRVIDFEP